MKKIIIALLLFIPNLLFAEVISYGEFIEKSAQQENTKKYNKNYYTGIDLLKDAYNAGLLTREDLETLTPQEIADKLKLDFYVFGQAIIDYQKSRIKGYTVPKTESYLRSYNHYLEGIVTGRIKSKDEITNAYRNGDIHPSDYQKLLEALDKNIKTKEETTNGLVKAGTKYVFTHIDIKIKDGQAALELKHDIEKALRQAITDGIVSDELEAMKYTEKYYNFLVQPEYRFR